MCRWWRPEKACRGYGASAQDPKTIQRATYLTWVAHNLERIADRVTNICERVVYLVEGKIEELNVSKY